MMVFKDVVVNVRKAKVHGRSGLTIFFLSWSKILQPKDSPEVNLAGCLFQDDLEESFQELLTGKQWVRGERAPGGVAVQTEVSAVTVIGVPAAVRRRGRGKRRRGRRGGRRRERRRRW